jgi:hypothetical protein
MKNQHENYSTHILSFGSAEPPIGNPSADAGLNVADLKEELRELVKRAYEVFASYTEVSEWAG